MRSALADLLPVADPPATLVGIEQEWQLWGADGQLDFRAVLPHLEVAVRGCDPSDRRATRLASGFALTADGWEAELATPPLALGRDVPDQLVRRLTAERHALGRMVEDRHPASWLEGFSTHVNVSVPDDLVEAVAQDFTRRCGIAASLLMGHAETPGLVVRPRRGRLEVCGDYLEGDDLTAAVVFVSACAAMLLVGEADDVLLPQPLGVEVVPARERYGHYLDRGAGGRDLFTELRATPLPGSDRSAQDHLEECWACARPFAVALGLDPSGVDGRVTGRVPLPGERRGRSSEPEQPAEPLVRELDVRTRHVDGDLTVELAWLTWAHAAWAVSDERGRTCHAVLPVEQQSAFLALLDAGRLTPLLRRALRPRIFSRVVAPVLVEAAQSSGPGIWKRVDPAALVPRERPLGGGHAGGGGAGGHDPKRERSEFEPRAPRFGRKLVPLAAAGAVALVLATVIGAVAVGGDDEATRSDGSPRDAASSPTSVQTTTAPPECADLSGVYRGTTLRKFRPIIGLDQSVSPARTESVRGRIECDEQVCRIRIDLLAKRFQRPIEVPATGGVDRFSRPSSGDPCSDRTIIANREEGWVRLDETGLRWRLVRYPDTYSTCPGGVFSGGSLDTGSATRTDG